MLLVARSVCCCVANVIEARIVLFAKSSTVRLGDLIPFIIGVCNALDFIARFRWICDINIHAFASHLITYNRLARVVRRWAFLYLLTIRAIITNSTLICHTFGVIDAAVFKLPAFVA